MRVVIVGGGKIGGYLAKELRTEGHTVTVIEMDPAHARRVSQDTEALVLVGDGTDVRMLEEAEVDRCDFLLAVTGRDEDNLVACQLARVAFEVENVLARLNDPRNRATFDALRVPVVSVTDLIAQVISREVDLSELVRVALLGRGEVSILEVEIPESVPSRVVSQINLPRSGVLVAVRRNGGVLVPGADTELRPGDRVLAVTLVELEDEVRDALTKPELDRAVDHPAGRLATATGVPETVLEEETGR